VGPLGEFGRVTSTDCPGTAAFDDVPVRRVHPPTVTVMIRIATMAAIVAGNRIVSLPEGGLPPINSMQNHLITVA
jgi:hypothetical protein